MAAQGRGRGASVTHVDMVENLHFCDMHQFDVMIVEAGLSYIVCVLYALQNLTSPTILRGKSWFSIYI